MKLDPSTMAMATGGLLVQGGTAGAVCTDTRAIRSGDWFLALVGERFDGHSFIQQAVDAGASGVIVSRALPSDWSHGGIVVSDTTKALQQLGQHARSLAQGPVIGLTGTTGKTTTRALIASALGAVMDVHQTKGNLNNHLGVPMTLLAAPRGVGAQVIEMGTSSPGEIRLLADLVDPDIRVILNVGPGHLEELGGLEGVAREKGALFRTASPGQCVCLNSDDEYVSRMATVEGVRRIQWGESEQADIQLLSCHVDPIQLTTHSTYKTPQGHIDVRLAVPGKYVAHNAGGALAVAMAMGVELTAAAEGLASYAPVGMRQKTEMLPGDVLAINDAYNANPVSMKAALTMLAGLQGRRVAVIGDMLELGSEEHEWHAAIVRYACTLDLDLLVLVGSRMAHASSNCTGPNVWSAEQGEDLVDPLNEWLDAGDRILFKGSRGARVERMLQRLKEKRLTAEGSSRCSIT